MQTFQISSGPVTKADMVEFEATLNTPAPEEGAEIAQTVTPDTDPANQAPTSPTNLNADEAKVWKQRQADSQRYINELKQGFAKEKKELLDKLKDASTQPTKYVSPEALKGFEEAFPDFAPFLKEYNEMTKKDAQKYADERIEQALAEREVQSQENTQALKRLSARHPDWPEYVEKTTAGGEIFAKWLEGQTPLINEMIISGEVDKVILVLDLFKSQGLGYKQTKNSGNNRKELTVSVQTTTPTDIAPTKAAFDMKKFDADWDRAIKRSNHKRMGELMADYEQAVKEGRIPH